MNLDIRNEIEFWTRIMRDHAQFQYTSLAPDETDAINTAAYFIDIFERLHSEARSNQVSVPALVSNSKTAVTQFIEFKRYMLTRLLTCNLQLRMTPSFLNHMINEALEFLHVLNLADRTIPTNNTLENIRLHKIWLPDASGHASAVAAEVDAVEADVIKEAKDFSKKFDSLFKKAFEMYTMYERTALDNGALRYFNEQVKTALTDFIVFLERIEDLKDDCRLFSSGTFSPHIPRHMMLEEGYYIYKINELSERFG